MTDARAELLRTISDELIAQDVDTEIFTQNTEPFVEIMLPGMATALQIEYADEPPFELVVMYRRWDQTHGLADERWIASFPTDAPTRVAKFVQWYLQDVMEVTEYGVRVV